MFSFNITMDLSMAAITFYWIIVSDYLSLTSAI